MMQMTLKLKDRFWDKVSIPSADGCWEWQGTKRGNGYGGIGTYYAHRLSYVWSFGPVPEGMNVCHKCDNPGCVNPAHLFVGSQTDNMRDALAKGRYCCGDRHHKAVLTEDQARYIRSYPPGRGSTSMLARRFGVDALTVGQIRRGRRWKWLANCP